MMNCPVCEHAQAQGASCDQCGRAFAILQHAAPVTLLSDLEPTRHDDEPDWLTPAMPELERTQLVERAMQASAPVSTTGGAVSCRYCQNLQEEGVLCDRCGMRLPRRAGKMSAAVGLSVGHGKRGSRTADALRTRCRACGAPALGGKPCGDCGRPVPIPEP